MVPPLFAAVGHNPFFKVRTPDPIFPTRRGLDPNRTEYGSKEGRYDVGGLPRGLVGHRSAQLRYTDASVRVVSTFSKP